MREYESRIETAFNGFRAYPTATTALATGVATKVTFETTALQVGTTYEPQTSKFSPGVGYWYVHACVNIPSPGAGLTWIALYKNGALEVYGTYWSAAPASTQTLQVDHFTRPSPNDYYEVYVMQSSGAPINTNTGAAASYFWAAQLA
jgi:hypothetical protein